VIDNEKLAATLRSFAVERDWDQFHTPKNLAASVSIEAGELLEQFQWTDPSTQQIRSDAAWLARVEDELADVALLTLLLSEQLGVPLEEAMLRKLAKNAQRYPAAEFKGSARKAER